MSPLSRGRVRLASSDPMAPSVVEPNFLAEPRHLATLVEAVRYLRKVVRTGPLAEFIGDEMLPGASVRKEERGDRKRCEMDS
ncbi:GMC oxidoreductase [Paraburkholderia sp.]|uniref:GMC oxidoreductase n=1 Tax=Paraburkholderia sp. TaxID=1926495 RepID=UPI00261B2511|nr:GMC oxidoreductase [Paraburkholderia sp.]